LKNVSISVNACSNHNKIKDHSTVSSTTSQPIHVPHYLTKSSSAPYASTTTVSVIETTTFEQKAAETELALSYNEYNENVSNSQEEAKANNVNEEENNEIDLTHTTESPTSDLSVTTFKFDRSTRDVREQEEHFPLLSPSNRIRSTKTLDENNSGRNMPEMGHVDSSFAWDWAKDILLQKPVMMKTSQN